MGDYYWEDEKVNKTLDLTLHTLRTLPTKPGMYGPLLDYFTGMVQCGGGQRIGPEEVASLLNQFNVTVIETLELCTNTVTDINLFKYMNEFSSSNGLVLQFLTLSTLKALTTHRTLMAYDVKKKKAAYFDSNGPVSATTPEWVRARLAESSRMLGFDTENFNMSADPQYQTQDSGCAGWSTMAAMRIAYRHFYGESIHLSIKDFSDVCDKDLPETLQRFMWYMVTLLFGPMELERNASSKFEAFKERVTIQGLSASEDVLLAVFQEHEGNMKDALLSLTMYQ
jgi:hypothetical protein